MKLWKYKDYEEYVRVQTEGNVSKIKNVWADQKVFDIIANYKPDAKDIICHGTRNGAELDMFKKAIPSLYYIVGTEISHTAKQFPNTIQHDFHEQIQSYVGKFDIVYSNSLDHSYDPYKALKTWTDQVNKNGMLCIELATGAENKMRELDPLEISPKELTQIIEEDFNFFNNDFKIINRHHRTNSLLGIFRR
tara:strand:+ start:15956 stop:16531 length:576 start_codon:yes stop_codon:yes gene_type:complete